MTWRNEITPDEHDERRAWCPACQQSPCIGPTGTKGSCLAADEDPPAPGARRT